MSPHFHWAWNNLVVIHICKQLNEPTRAIGQKMSRIPLFITRPWCRHKMESRCWIALRKIFFQVRRWMGSAFQSSCTFFGWDNSSNGNSKIGDMRVLASYTIRKGKYCLSPRKQKIETLWWNTPICLSESSRWKR